MSVEITLPEFYAAFAQKVAPELAGMHPAGATHIEHWLHEMHDAAHAGQPHEVARLARMVSAQIAQEREWEAENLADIKRLAQACPAPG